ncbi:MULTISPECIES: hypothetical protein [unclassified Streptomyces]|uniref:hypothetical protein n=1 Tax=unclassified Streptomyces TaxID=2593676 RepID=UPI00382F1FEE
MGENVSVCCPSCGGRHTFVAPVHPCLCGAPVAPPLAKEAPVEPVTYRTWAEEWVTVRCAACGRDGDWPRPELGCPCGAMLRIPVRETGAPEVRESGPAAERPTRVPPPRAATSPRTPFHPATIRTPRDAVSAAALYLRWLGFRSVVRTEGEPDSGVDLRGPDVVAQVDPGTGPASLRAVECLWLDGLAASAVGVYFSLAGYAEDARARADALGIPLFVLDLTGAPQPVNGPADELVSAGAPSPD